MTLSTFITPLVFSFLLLISTIQVSAQDLNKTAQKDIKKLCSKKLKGRGYTFDGDKKAAKYISKRLRKIGLEAQSHSFEFSANVFPKHVSCHLNEQQLVTGIDYIIAPNSPRFYGEAELFLIDVSATFEEIVFDIKDGNSERFLVFDQQAIQDLESEKRQKVSQLITQLQYTGEYICKGILMKNVPKLTFSASQTQAKLPKIILLDKHKIKTFDKISLELDAELKPNYKSQNIYAKIESPSDSSIVFTAHYDHLGTMGKKVYFPGANDNASGVSFLLALADYYKEHPPKYDIYFIFFSGEEIGLLGSTAFVEDQIIDLKQIKFLLNFDLMGTGEDGIQVVNSSLYPNQYQALNQINRSSSYIKTVKRRGEACNSDHCPFHRKGVPAFFTYTLGGISAYHDVFDVPETLPLTEFNDLQKLYIDFVNQL